MPTYEYECKSCGADFDVFQSMAEDPLKVCPTCGKDVRRKISKGTGIIFKGSGFYKNDSRKPAAKDDAPADGATIKSDSDSSPAGAPSSASATPAQAPTTSSSSTSAAPKKEAG